MGSNVKLWRVTIVAPTELLSLSPSASFPHTQRVLDVKATSAASALTGALRAAVPRPADAELTVAQIESRATAISWRLASVRVEFLRDDAMETGGDRPLPTFEAPETFEAWRDRVERRLERLEDAVDDCTDEED